MRIEHRKNGEFSKLIVFAQSKADVQAFYKFMDRKLIAIEITSEVIDFRDTEKEGKE